MRPVAGCKVAALNQGRVQPDSDFYKRMDETPPTGRASSSGRSRTPEPALLAGAKEALDKDLATVSRRRDDARGRDPGGMPAGA
jgi:hypothetical protein